MYDTRQFTKQAHDVVATGKKIILRYQLKNGHILERIIEPVMNVSNEGVRYYSDTKREYALKEGTTFENIYDIPEKNLVKLGKEILPTTTTKNGVIIHLLESLLSLGYVMKK